MQNAYIERLNKTYQENILNASLFDCIDEVRPVTKQWVNDYNKAIPHDALGGLPPAIYRKKKGHPVG